MKNNEIVSALVGWAIIGVAYMVGRKHGYDKGVLKCKEVLCNVIIENDKKKEEES